MNAFAQEQSVEENSRFSNCLASKLKTRRYRSLDKTRAIIVLRRDCANEWKEFRDICVQVRAKLKLTEEDCNLRGAVLAAAATEMLNDEDGQNWDDLADRLSKSPSNIRQAKPQNQLSQSVEKKIENHPDGSISVDYGNMVTTGRDFKWPPWMKTWRECVERARILSFKNGFQPPAENMPWTGYYANEVVASSHYYHLALHWRCSSAGGERMVGVDVTSFPEYPKLIPPRELLEKLGVDFGQ